MKRFNTSLFLLRRALLIALVGAGMLAGASGPALSNTSSNPINTYPPPNGSGAFSICGVGCLSCCNCCPNGVPQSYLNGTPGYSALRNWIRTTLYNGQVIPAYGNQGQQVSSNALLEGRMIGGFYDAQNFVNATMTLQRLTTEAIRDYAPSEAVCQFGTLSRSLAATNEKARAGQRVMSEVNLARALGSYGSISSAGRGQDNSDRIENFVAHLCNPADNNNVLESMCASGTANSRHNRDIDYVRLLAVPETVRADFTDANVTTSESDLITLGHNLYGNVQWIKRIDDDSLTATNGQQLYLLQRSVAAKRALAENSYNTLVGMKSLGTQASATYMDNALKNLGMQQDDRNRYVATVAASSGSGTATGYPSYYAQMEILTKRIYQDPAFFVNLMDKRANVARQQASMEGLELMQGRDIHTSMSRSEMLLGMLVELEAVRLQNKVLEKRTAK